MVSCAGTPICCSAGHAPVGSGDTGPPALLEGVKHPAEEGVGYIAVLVEPPVDETAQKAGIILAGDFSPAFALKHALKDAELAAVAAQASGTELTLTQALLPQWRRAASDGHAEDDLAAIYAAT